MENLLPGVNRISVVIIFVRDDIDPVWSLAFIYLILYSCFC